MIEGPLTGVPRQSFTFRRLVLTPFVLKKLPRAAGTTVVRKVFEESDVLAKWEKSAWAVRRKAIEMRRATSDFERFELMLLKKQRRRVVQVRLTLPSSACPLPLPPRLPCDPLAFELELTYIVQAAEAKAKKSA